MAITVPDRIHFDPYGDSGIIVTRAPGRILFELPCLGFWSVSPLYFISGLIWLAAITFGTLAIINQQQWDPLWFMLIMCVLGGLPALFGLYLSSHRGTIEITPEHLGITERAWGRVAMVSLFAWEHIAGFHVGFGGEEGPVGLVIEKHDGKETRVFSRRSMEELERLEGLLKSLIPPRVTSLIAAEPPR